MIMVYSLVNATSGMPPDFTYSACKVSLTTLFHPGVDVEIKCVNNLQIEIPCVCFF